MQPDTGALDKLGVVNYVGLFCPGKRTLKLLWGNALGEAPQGLTR